MFDTFLKEKKNLFDFVFFLIMISLYTPSNKNKPSQKQHNYFNHFTIKS